MTKPTNSSKKISPPKTRQKEIRQKETGQKEIGQKETNANAVDLSKKRHYLLDPQLVVAIAVVFISVCALYVSLMQARIMNKQYEIMQEQSKASVWPRLEISASIGRDPINKITSLGGITVKNQGVGPAIIEGIRVSYKGQYVKTWKALYEVLQKPDSINAFASTGTLNRRVIKASETFNWIQFEKNAYDMKAFIHKFAKDIHLELCYRSVYKDYWVITRKGIAGGEEPVYQKVDACTFKKEERFLD